MHYGLDIGGTKIELAIFNVHFERIDCWRAATPTQDYREFLRTLTDMVIAADEKTQTRGSVGIGLPGIVDQQGRLVSANIPAINGQPFSTDIVKRLKRPVALENDVKAFVLSEVNGGVADGVRHALGLVLGTGVAGGLCIDGKIYRGRQNAAGEYGHIPLPAILQQRYRLPLRQCACGLRSCMEQYLAGAGLLCLGTHLGGDYASVQALAQARQAGDAKAVEIFSAYVDCLGCYLAQLTLLYDPDMIVLGGGLSNISELYPSLPAAMQAYLFEGIEAPTVVAASFGDSSGVRGAAILGQ